MENLQIWLRTPLRTFEAEIAQKIRTSSLSKKKGVLIKKKSVDKGAAKINEIAEPRSRATAERTQINKHR